MAPVSRRVWICLTEPSLLTILAGLQYGLTHLGEMRGDGGRFAGMDVFLPT